MDLSWMAWTKPVAAFFIIIVCFLVTLTVWEIKVPGGAPRKGILGFTTTRGDRLFVSLLGSAYIHIFWLGLTSLSLWWALVIAIIYAICVFIWV
jgi:predicted small integral membrane protein